MCYYEQIRFACGDWRWGSFTQQCHQEYRRGETCGMKLPWPSTARPDLCKICEKIQTKRRRMERLLQSVARWQRDGGKLTHSIEKACEEAKSLEMEIYRLEVERANRARSLR